MAGHYISARVAERGQIDRAIQRYHKAIELAPEDAERIIAWRARVANSCRAIYRYRRTLEIEPDSRCVARPRVDYCDGD